MPTAPTLLIIGASRGLGHAMAAEFLKRGWNVVGTVRGTARTMLHDLAGAFVLMAPGWVRTALGGPDARLTIEDSVPNLVNVLLAQQGTRGLQYLDYLGRTVPW